MMNKTEIKLGIAPIGWTNDDLPELGGRTKLEALGMDVHVLCEFEGA